MAFVSNSSLHPTQVNNSTEKDAGQRLISRSLHPNQLIGKLEWTLDRVLSSNSWPTSTVTANANYNRTLGQGCQNSLHQFQTTDAAGIDAGRALRQYAG